MTTLPTRSFTTIVANIAAGMQARTPRFLNFATGSVFKALAQALGGIILWFQSLVIELLTRTRLSTSNGVDVDTFIADFFGPGWRLGARPATGLVTFSRFTPSASTPFIPVGSLVKTTDGKQTFAVYIDTNNPLYSAALGGYTMPAQLLTVKIPVQGITNGVSGFPGTNGNIAAGTISLLASSVSGIDAVTNEAAFTNGSDSEGDPAVKTRFRGEFRSLSKGTIPAIKQAVYNLEVGLEVEAVPNVYLDGTPTLGWVTVVVDDGSGNLPAATLQLAWDAIEGVEAGGIRYGVYSATPVYANVVATIGVKTGYVYTTVVAQVIATVTDAITALPMEDDLQYFDIADWIKGVPGVAKLHNLTLNGQVGVDMTHQLGNVFKPGSVTVS